MLRNSHMYTKLNIARVMPFQIMERHTIPFNRTFSHLVIQITVMIKKGMAQKDTQF